MSVDGSDVYNGFCLRVIRDRGGRATISQLRDASYGITSEIIDALIEDGFMKIDGIPKFAEPDMTLVSAGFMKRDDKILLGENIVELTVKGAMALEKGSV